MAYGRRHPIYRYTVGHKAHSLVTAGGLRLVTITAPGNQLDHTHLLALLERFRDLYPDLDIAYLLPGRGYDVDALYRTVYEDFDMIPVASRKSNIRGRPRGVYGLELDRRGTDYARRRTKFCRCRAADATPDPGWQTLPASAAARPRLHLLHPLRVELPRVRPLTSDMSLFDKLYRLRTDVERGVPAVHAGVPPPS